MDNEKKENALRKLEDVETLFKAGKNDLEIAKETGIKSYLVPHYRAMIGLAYRRCGGMFSNELSFWLDATGNLRGTTLAIPKSEFDNLGISKRKKYKYSAESKRGQIVISLREV